MAEGERRSEPEINTVFFISPISTLTPTATVEEIYFHDYKTSTITD
jgi:hypothetical protein